METTKKTNDLNENPSCSSSDEDNFEDATNNTNDTIIEEIIEKHQIFSIHDNQNDVSPSPPIFDDESELKTNEPEHNITNGNVNNISNDLIDDEKQNELELKLTDNELEENRLRSEELKENGNLAFKNSEYEQSIELYTNGLKLCPIRYTNNRSILYANRAAAKIKLDAKESAIGDCTKALEYNPNYVKALIRRAKLYEETEKYEDSLEDYKKILELEPSHSEAKDAINRLQPLIHEKNEKLKTEMMGKLKDLGNLVLKPFGLSTNNFQMQQDPSTGSYSINFKQN